jgi:hypothetical protein
MDQPSSLLQHIQHFRLEDMVHRFNSYRRTRLRHRKDINAGDLPLANIS